MNLPPPAPRRPKYKRSIVCEGYEREDGLWDIEARVIDTKAVRYREPFRGMREPGEHVHDMAVRLTIDKDKVVRGVETAMLSVPYSPCASTLPAYQGLIGKKIGKGWRRAVQDCVGGVKGCTHLRELLFPVATIAFQTLGNWGEGDEPVAALKSDTQRPHFIDGCKAWAEDGEIVAQLYPQFHRKAE